VDTPTRRLCGALADRQSVRAPTVYGDDPDQDFWQCSVCDAIYPYPPTGEEADSSFYEDGFDKWMAKRSGDKACDDPADQFGKWGERDLPRRGPWLKRLLSPGDRVLEIGSVKSHGVDG
jgi:hypothetical protein